MSMIHPHPVLDPNAQAKSMIDAVTGHQPSPLDSEYSSETPICTTRRLRSAKVGAVTARAATIEPSHCNGHSEAAPLPRLARTVCTVANGPPKFLSELKN